MLVVSVFVLSALIGLGICFAVGAFASLTWLWVLPLGFLGSFAVLSGLAFLFLYYMCQRVDVSVPQEHDDPFFRKMIYLYCEAICFILQMRLRTTGLEKTPKEGRFLLVCNHLFDLDPVVLYTCFQKSQLAFISKRENSSMFLVGKAMHPLMCQLINRENDREALKTILKCIQLIKDDEVSVAVFPEGYIPDDGHLLPLRSGVLKIALKAKVPIVVCTLQNTDKVYANARRLKHTDIHLHLLDVISVEQQQGKTAVALGEQIYQMMANDLGPDYAPLPAENA